jgi:SAM-dependent methyltransferase/uncharacterized protein YbaR (Trm112 family)
MIELSCPMCRGEVQELDDGYRCRSCVAVYRCIDGIFRFLPPERVEQFSSFLHDYTTVRVAEGRGSIDPAFFRRLPDYPSGGPLAGQWRMRQRSWAALRKRVIEPQTKRLRVIDVGAGVGWMSNRLTLLGHDAHAVDLTVDRVDGLGAARHYETELACFQAEMDALPFADRSADLVVFNASFHYSCDARRTMAEAVRVVAPEGRIVIVDSPIYRHRSSGESMVHERHVDFERRFGIRSDSLPSIGFLTPEMLDDLGQSVGWVWERHRPWYGWAWAMKPWKARVLRRREPSRFELLVARRGDHTVAVACGP